MNWKPYFTVAMVGLLGQSAGANVFAASAKVTQEGNTTAITLPSVGTQLGGDTIDYVNAKPMKLPIAPVPSDTGMQSDFSSQPVVGEPKYWAGKMGNGAKTPIYLGAPQVADGDTDEITPQEFGTNNHPFSTARADLSIVTNTAYPYRASGKLFFNIGTSTFVCSASLIKRGVIVTAAHCVANFGKNQFYTNWKFVPGYRSGVAPFGVWTVKQARVLTAYFNGTDTCAVAGVVCLDDVAILTVNTSAAGAYPGTATGWYYYGVNGYGFTASGLTQITQIGYPVCLDNGALMERNDSYGVKTAAQSNNTVIGSLMCGGSSGGPWLVNFGIRPTLTATTAGTASVANVVVGVTSWGYTSTAPKEQGASPFLSTNISPLISAACTATPAACS